MTKTYCMRQGQKYASMDNQSVMQEGLLEVLQLYTAIGCVQEVPLACRTSTDWHTVMSHGVLHACALNLRAGVIMQEVLLEVLRHYTEIGCVQKVPLASRLSTDWQPLSYHTLSWMQVPSI